MLSYALIGLGGAIGSILRAWLGTVMVTLTGPGFPWGTILINVVGSFAIGGFATLTATDGRFAVPFDARSFVMVGLCGGFTTFSSFSLQTLELARDGRAGQALGNVALSVLLCLAGVACGSWLALAVRASSLAAVADDTQDGLRGGTLVALYRPAAVPSMLMAADRLMADGGGRTTVLAIDGPILAELQPTEEVLTQERRQEVADHRRCWVEAMRPALDRWVAAERARGRQARWIAVGGDGTPAIAEHSRGARLVLMEHEPGDGDGYPRIRAALRAGRPVLLVPSGAAADLGRVVAVAWRDDPDVRQAIRTATPLLSRAERVVVLRVGDEAADADVPDVLTNAGCETVAVPAPADGDVGARLVAMAREAGADLLVMGGGHDDGVTGTVLRSADLAVLLGHRGA